MKSLSYEQDLILQLSKLTPTTGYFKSINHIDEQDSSAILQYISESSKWLRAVDQWNQPHYTNTYLKLEIIWSSEDGGLVFTKI